MAGFGNFLISSGGKAEWRREKGRRMKSKTDLTGWKGTVAGLVRTRCVEFARRGWGRRLNLLRTVRSVNRGRRLHGKIRSGARKTMKNKNSRTDPFNQAQQ